MVKVIYGINFYFVDSFEYVFNFYLLDSFICILIKKYGFGIISFVIKKKIKIKLKNYDSFVMKWELMKV